MSSIFTKIINGDIPSYKIAEDDRYYAMLDINPLAKGHTLIIPKEEKDYVFYHSDDLIAGLIVFAKKVGLAIEEVVPCKRLGLVILGLEVPHTHIHLIPINTEKDISFSNPRLQLASDEFKQLAQLIAQKVNL